MEQLTREELETMIIAITLWNSGKLEFDKGYLSYTTLFKPEVAVIDDTITIVVDPASIKEH